MRTKLLIAAAAGMVFASQAYADSGSYNAEPYNSYNAEPYDAYNSLGAGAVDLSGATLNKSELNQEVSGVSVEAPAGKYAAGGVSTSSVQGSTLSSTAGVVVQSTNTGIASNLGVASTLAIGTINVK